MTPERIKELRELYEKATPGPWFNDHNSIKQENSPRKYGDYIAWGISHTHYPMQSKEQDNANCDFIAASRTAIPELLDYIERLHQRLIHIYNPGSAGIQIK